MVIIPVQMEHLVHNRTLTTSANAVQHSTAHSVTIVRLHDHFIFHVLLMYITGFLYMSVVK